jgi:hypothetical protein
MSSTTPQITALQQLTVERDIQRLLATYVHYLDDGKFAEIGKLFGDAEFEVLGNTASGRDAIEQFMIDGVQRHDDGTPRTWHSLSNALIDIDPAGERASSVTYFTVHQALEGLPLQPICTGRYHDTFELRDGAWRFLTRSVVPRHVGELRFHANLPEGALLP